MIRKNSINITCTTLLVQSLIFIGTSSYHNLCEAYVPASDLNRDDIAGVWKLTRKKSFLPTLLDSASEDGGKVKPLKEFTVFPKKKKIRKEGIGEKASEKNEDFFIKLLEDGSFVQFGKFDSSDQNYDDDEDDDLEDEEVTINTNKESKENGPSSESMETILGLSEMKGTWDFVDGKLILATDRPSDVDTKQVHDTVLEGLVVAVSETSLTENPALPYMNDTKNGTSVSSSNINTTLSFSESSSTKNKMNRVDEKSVDTHLSVLDGLIKIGKFMYPKQHPSFFEQTIFHPTSAGTFELRQVLGNLNTKLAYKDDKVEKFRREDFHGKSFFLTSRPLQYRAKGKLIWNRSLGQYVKEKPKIDPNEKIDIKVMQINFFHNNTFSTDGGVSGDINKVLRGKWNVIGYDSDQLWMQVLRFGFGRSVSGSTYSEGNYLTQNDERSYWGQIHEVIHKRNIPKENKDESQGEHDATIKKTLEIRGSVLFGWGLEPEPIGRFTMIEQTEMLNDDYDEDENDDNDNYQEYQNYRDEAKNKMGEEDDESNEDRFFDSVFE